MLLTLALPAVALDLVAAASLPLDPPAVALAVLPAEVALLGDTRVDLVDPADASPVAHVDHGARGALLRETDGDGLDELWLCADDGVWRVPRLDRTNFGAPVVVVAAPCRAFAAVSGGLVIAGDGDVGLWTDDGAGGLVAVAWSGSVDLGATPALVGDGTRAVGAAVGAAQVYLLTLEGATARGTAGGVGGVTLVDGLAAWSLPGHGVLEDEHGRRVGIAADAGAPAPADLDGDGLLDLVLPHPGLDVVGVVDDAWAGETLVEAPGWTAAVGVPGVRCDAIWGLAEGGASLVRMEVADCGDDDDDDGDGWTVGAGDCDDADPATHPEATTGCERADRDCDGEVDALALVSRVAAVWEGTEFVFATPAECPPETLLNAAPADPVAAWCDVTTREPRCAVWDEGVAVFRLEVRIDQATAGTVDVEVTALNVAPELDPALSLPTAVDGALWVGTLVAVDPGTEDTTTFTLVDGPAGLELSGATLRWTPTGADRGVHAVTVDVADEDGGVSRGTVEITVVDAVEVDGPGLCGGSLAGILVGVGWGVGRRRRGRATRG